MKKRQVHIFTLLCTGLFFVTLGIFILFWGQQSLNTIIKVVGIGISLTEAFSLLSFFIRKGNDKQLIGILIKSLVSIVFGILIYFNDQLVLISLTLLFAIYLALLCLINLINYGIHVANHIKGRLKILFDLVYHLVFLWLLAFLPNYNMTYITLILGIYFILYGIIDITNFISEITPPRVSNKIKNQFSLALPICFAAFIPRQLVQMVNEMVEVDPKASDFNYDKKKTDPDVEVIIHLAHSGTASMGHVEIGFEGSIYSYANYDWNSRKLFGGIGDGVILVADYEKYIKYMVSKRNRYVVVFGIQLTDTERQAIKNKIDSLVYTNTKPYYPDSQLAEKGMLPRKEYKDLSSEIYQYADGVFYKITSGKYKRLFVLKTNCVYVAQSILSAVGKNVLTMNGIITPGAYYDYFNGRFMMKNTNVITRKIYTKADYEEQ